MTSKTNQATQEKRTSREAVRAPFCNINLQASPTLPTHISFKQDGEVEN